MMGLGTGIFRFIRKNPAPKGMKIYSFLEANENRANRSSSAPHQAAGSARL
jgi:hypothetical protein